MRTLSDRALTDHEWDLVPPDSDVGRLLPVVLARDGQDAAARLVSRLPDQTRRVLATAAMCLSRRIPRDLIDPILVHCAY